MAAMLPPEWEIRLSDLNAEELDVRDVEWADIVFLGGMIAQQPDHLYLIDYFKSLGKIVVVGGPTQHRVPAFTIRPTILCLGKPR